MNEQDRRSFIKTITGASLALGFGLPGCTSALRTIPGAQLGAEMALGHRMRDGFDFSSPTATRSCEYLIVGAGVSGLSAARQLKKQGQQDILLLELADQPGGNSRGGKRDGKAYPWGAHYLPVPGPELPEIQGLLEDFGAIYDYQDGKPLFEEQYLCHAPQERLLINGRWQEDLIPNYGISDHDKAHIQAFFSLVGELQQAKGTDGLPAFALPLHRSSKDERFRQWDRINMATFLDQQRWTSPFLRWYVNYCCRDDFGGTLSQTSAWAGLHYFCSRRGGGANAGTQDVLTWPEGNAWLTNRLADDVKTHLQCNALVLSLQNTERGVRALYLDVRKGEVIAVEARKAIFAGPQHVASRLLPDRTLPSKLPAVPWVTANIEVRRPPQGLGVPLAWDNVSYTSPSLGYVHADHQRLQVYPQSEHILTWYHVLSEDDLLAARKRAAETSYSDWQAFILEDLRSMHPNIEDDIRRLDLWVWGHGMTRPEPGFLENESRLVAAKPHGNIHFAHTDLSGISIFEEAFYQGIRAVDEL